MARLLDSLKLLADGTRVRVLALLQAQELSVAELQEILGMGQSRISTQLAQLRQAGLLRDRRVGKNILYGPADSAIEPTDPLHRVWELATLAATELPTAAEDEAALQLVLRKRSDKARAYFDQLAGKFGRTYVPGRSWKSLSEALLKLMTPQVIVDMGAGEGTLAQLMAQRAEKVIAVDNSPKMVEFGSQLAREHKVPNLEYRLGDLESPPVENNTADLVFFSQALHHAHRPAQAIAEAFRILRPGGRVVILDLLRHDFEDARELYAHVWLGFSEVELETFLRDAGFTSIQTALVDKESEPPHFQTLLGLGMKG